MTKEDGFQSLSKFLGEQIKRLNEIHANSFSERNELYLYRWMVEMRLYVQESAFVENGSRIWCVLDVDGEIVGQGKTAIAALQKAHDFVDNPSDEESAIRDELRRTERELDRADNLRDVAKDERQWAKSQGE